MNQNSNKPFPQNLPDIPWWAIIVGFVVASPIGIGLLIAKILKDSAPDRDRWNQSGSYHGTEKSVRFDSQTTGSQVRYTQPGSSARSTSGYNGSTGTTGGSSVKGTYSTGRKRRFPFVKIPTGKGWITAGSIVTALFSLCGTIAFADWGFRYLEYAIEDSLPLFAIALMGVGMLIWGNFTNRQSRKFKKYLARIGDEPRIPLRPLAQSLAADMDEVCDTLQKMIDMGVFGERAYLDLNAEELVTDGSAPKAVPVKKAEPKQAEPAKPKAPEMSDEDKILKEIRDANDRIPGEEISRKIDRIEEITRHILRYLKKHPERAVELHTFLDYYLPTTLKMLNTYAELDSQGLDVDSVSATKQRIEGILDKVVEGFEVQLDKLFEGDMLDISSDIDVMERMLQRDGLAGDMKMPRPAAPKAPKKAASSTKSGYTPTLTLDPSNTNGGAAMAAAPEDEYDTLGQL